MSCRGKFTALRELWAEGINRVFGNGKEGCNPQFYFCLEEEMLPKIVLKTIRQL